MFVTISGHLLEESIDGFDNVCSSFAAVQLTELPVHDHCFHDTGEEY